MACRPLYHPHVGQTTWGNLVWWHWGQTLRGGVERFHALARRLRLFALDVFFFGTAMIDSAPGQYGEPTGSSGVGWAGIRKVRPPSPSRRQAD